MWSTEGRSKQRISSKFFEIQAQEVMEQVEEKGRGRHNNGILIDIPYQDTQVF